MHPILFEFQGFPLYTYGLLLAAAYLLGLQFAIVRARSRGLDQNRVMDLGIWIIVSALIGAKAMLVIVERDRFEWTVAELVNLFRSAGVFYGGLITDVFAPGIALGHIVGRLGCLLAGCCFGRQTDVPWAVTFTSEFAARQSGTPLGVPLHPTQLYEAGAELLILILLLAMERRGRPFAGRTFWSYMLLYAVSRFIIEFYRGDSRGLIDLVGMSLSTSQFVSLLIAPLSIVMLVFLGRRQSPSPAGAAAGKVRAA
jgi:phosphatidylglycerol:prolipoprotein diacylglycerol transferase